MRIKEPGDLDRIDFDKQGGLVPTVSQDARTGEILMLAYANRDALERTLATGDLWLYSRSRDELWHKGATSGNTQRVRSVHLDCDADAVVALVVPTGPACHTGARTCFDAPPLLTELDDVIASRAKADPDTSYTARLLADDNLRLKKLGEEAVELALAAERGDAVPSEAADLLYHLLVTLRGTGLGLRDVLQELETRRHPTG